MLAINGKRWYNIQAFSTVAFCNVSNAWRKANINIDDPLHRLCFCIADISDRNAVFAMKTVKMLLVGASKKMKL